MTRGAEPKHVDPTAPAPPVAAPTRRHRDRARSSHRWHSAVSTPGRRRQYFVGRSGDEVAIFRGVNTDFGPLKFYKVYDEHPDQDVGSDAGGAQPGRVGHHRAQPGGCTADRFQPADPATAGVPHRDTYADAHADADADAESDPADDQPGDCDRPVPPAHDGPCGPAPHDRTPLPRTSTTPRVSAHPTVVAPSPPPLTPIPFPSSTQQREGCR